MSQPNAKRPAGLERLIVLGLVTNFLVLLLVVVVALFAAGRLRYQAAQLADHTTLLEQLQQRLPPANSIDAFPPTTPGAAATSEPASSSPPSTQSAVPAPPPNDSLTGMIDAALDDSGLDIRDPGAADAALTAALGGLRQVPRSGEDNARLAVLAKRLHRKDDAESFAAQAMRAGVAPRNYDLLCAREALQAEAYAEALVHARRLTAADPSLPQRVLLAHILLRLGDKARASDALADAAGADGLRIADQLTLAEAYVALERWDALAGLIPHMEESAASRPRLERLRAISAVQSGNPADALATLGRLLAETPGDYDLRVWRGVALLKAGRADEARQAFEVTEQTPARPEGWYWRGMLELQSAAPDDALLSFQRALNADAGFAPAWEARAKIQFDRGDLDAATASLRAALESNERRASSHFLLAMVLARAGNASAAAASLKTAVALEPSLRAAAEQTEILRAASQNAALAP